MGEWNPAKQDSLFVRSVQEVIVHFIILEGYTHVNRNDDSNEFEVENGSAIARPEFQGGPSGFSKFLMKSINYPELAMLNDISGKFI